MLFIFTVHSGFSKNLGLNIMQQIMNLLKMFGLITLFCGIALKNAYANDVIAIPTQPQPLVMTPSAPNLDAKGYILIDAASGKILAEKNSNERMAPASLTKLMSLYIISSALKMG